MATPEAGLPRSIGAPATRALTAAGYTELSQLADVPAAELAKLHGVGPKALRLLQEALHEQGMSLG
jgi:predicted flap endonuclease-1-like 5' DNA nuclease